MSEIRVRVRLRGAVLEFRGSAALFARAVEPLLEGMGPAPAQGAPEGPAVPARSEPAAGLARDSKNSSCRSTWWGIFRQPCS